MSVCVYILSSTVIITISLKTKQVYIDCVDILIVWKYRLCGIIDCVDVSIVWKYRLCGYIDCVETSTVWMYRLCGNIDSMERIKKEYACVYLKLGLICEVLWQTVCDTAIFLSRK